MLCCWLKCSKILEICIENYKLDPCHYLTAPVLSWDAMLKMTELNLELLTNIDMHLFIEKGIRGGIASIIDFPKPTMHIYKTMMQISHQNILLI